MNSTTYCSNSLNRPKYKNLFILNTYQNYLKATRHTLELEILKYRYLGIPLRVKIVRGAYMVEENQISQKTGDYIINESIEKTHETYDMNMLKLIHNIGSDGRVLFGSHNEDTVLLGMNTIHDLGYDSETRNRIIFGQLYGFGDQLSHYLNKEGFRIVKYIPYGEADIIFPYLTRRAQESKIMLEKNATPFELLKDEVLKRFVPFSN